MGFILDAQGIHPSESKLTAIRNFPRPTNISELKSFIGLVIYYARFVPNLATVLSPLYVLLRKGVVWKWDSAQEKAFVNCCNAITSDACLVHFDASKPILVQCDASPVGLGAVLSHRMPDGTERPFMFASRSLNSHERNYSQLDKKALGLIFAVLGD